MERVFTEPFNIGRGMQATLHIDSGRVSRIHVEVIEEGGAWVLRDAGSTNGTYHNGERVERVSLSGETTVRLGKDGPFVYLSVDAPLRAGISESQEERAVVPTEPEAKRHPFYDGTAQQPAAQDTQRQSDTYSSSANGATQHNTGPVSRGTGERAGGSAPASVSQVIRHYFDERKDEPAGERTMMIRQAFQEVQQKQKLAYGKVIAGVAALLIVALGFAIWQQFRVAALEQSTVALFYEMKEQDIAIAQLRLLAEEEGNDDLAAQLDNLEEGRRRTAERYAGYVEELGLYRRLTPEEREIYRVARIFNESEFTIPAGFVREVQEIIDEWQQSTRFQNAIRRAEANGYTRDIVETFIDYGLPPEFFYLALQESNFDACAVGPPTRWGIAKGMWQFIPSTGQHYGLVPGPRVEQRVPDPIDERCDVPKATDAAARYLLAIYTELAQASGLLVMASYNWGEHRVSPRLDNLTPLEVVQHDLEGIPQNPQERNYWRFLSEHRDRMPDQTKDYVLHIFSAAVIGQNPRLFGFDFDNPLQRYLEDAVASPIAHAPPARP